MAESSAMIQRVAKEEAKLRKRLAQQLALDIERLDVQHLSDNSKLKKIVKTDLHDTNTHSYDVNTSIDDTCTTLEKEKPLQSCELNSGVSTSEGVSDLATELLRLYHNSEETDISIEVKDKEFKAHREILIVRSEYFSAMLCGGWQESDTGTFTLQGITPGTFEHLLNFMYGGMLTSDLSDEELRHLVVATDMYMLPGFLEMLIFLLKKNICHFFHKPCSGCAVKIVNVLPMTYSYHSFNTIYQSAVEWVNKNYTRIWVTEGFARLPSEILQDCRQNLIDGLGVSNVLSIVVDTSYMLDRLTTFHSFQPVNRQLVKIREACIFYIANHFVAVLGNKSFLELNKGRSWGLITVENIFAEALKHHPIDSICTSYMQLCSFGRVTLGGLMVGMEFTAMVRCLVKSCKQEITHRVNQIIDTDDWKVLPFEVQKEVTEQAYFVKVGSGAIKKKPKLSSQFKKPAMPRSLRAPKTKQHPKTSSKTKAKSKDLACADEHSGSEVNQCTAQPIDGASNSTPFNGIEGGHTAENCDEAFGDGGIPHMMNGLVDLEIDLPEGQVFNEDAIQPLFNVVFHKP